MTSTGFFKRDKSDYKLLIYNKPFRKRMKWIRLKPVWISIDKYNPKKITPRRVSWSESDMNKLFDYIKDNYNHFEDHILYDHADSKLHDRLHGRFFNNDYYCLLWKENTKLPIDLFLPDKESTDLCVPYIVADWILVSISDDPIILDEYGFEFKNPEDFYSKSEMWVIKEFIFPFIKRYKELLLKNWNREPLGDFTFLDIMYQNRDFYPSDFHGWNSSRIGNTKDGADIYVDTFDFNKTPHFHYQKGNIKVAISLIDPKYISHYLCDYKLSDEEKNDLIEFLEENKTRLIREWNRNNETDEKLDVDYNYPNYRRFL
jgi:hypothetical protein